MILATLFCLLLLVFLRALDKLEYDRFQLVQRFSEERLTALKTVTQDVEDDFQDILDDLFFMVQLLRSEPIDGKHKPIIEMLLSANKAYHSAILYQCDKNMSLLVTDPHRRGAVSSEILSEMKKTGEKVISSEDTEVQVSPLIQWEQISMRVFAIKLDGQEHCRGGRAVALAVNTGMFLKKLQLVTADRDTHLLVLGPHGFPTPFSSDALEKAFQVHSRLGKNEFSSFSQLIRKMRSGGSGIATIGQEEAQKLGLGKGEVIAVYSTMQADKKNYWAVATFTSMAALRNHEKKIILRFVFVSVTVVLLLIAVGVYIIVSGQKRAVLQERVRHFDEVARLHEKAKKTLDSIPIDILTISSDLCVTDVNHAFSRRSGVLCPGSSLCDTLTLADRSAFERLESLVKSALASREETSIVGAKLRLYGEDGYFSIHAVPLEPSSENTLLLLVIEDLSKLKSLESQLLAAEKLTTVGILAAGIAHEVGTPLCIVRGRAEYLIDKLGEASPHVPGLQVMIDQIDRVSRIIRGLLDFSRSKAVSISPVDPDSLLHNCMDLLQYEAGRRQVSLEIQLAESLPPAAADGDQLQQVMINLIMNALDASPPNEKVIVTVSVATVIEAAIREKVLQIEVKDHGCGIPEENIHQVFDPFFTTKKRGQGTGLGLAIVSDIIRNHRARIEIDSKIGQGTRVILAWPIAG